MYTQTIRQSLTTLLHNAKRFTARSTRSAIFALLAVALLTSNVSAALIQTNLVAPVKSEFVRKTLVSVKPALNSSVNEVLPRSLLTMVNDGIITPATANNYRLIFIQGKAPEGMPEIAQMLSLPKDEQVNYALQKLTEAGQLSKAEAKMLLDLSASGEPNRDTVVAALENGSYGPLATAILQVVADLTSIDPDADLAVCETSSSAVVAQGFFKWLAGLVDAVIDGAIKGAFYGMLFGHAEAGAIIGGIAGGIKYIADSTGGNGFMPGPNGEDCTGWPRPYPRF